MAPGGFPRLRKTLASTLALPPDLRQKVEESFNGLKRGSATMHSRTCMVGLGNFHGSALRLPWLDSATSMVQLCDFHGWTSQLPWFSFRRCMVQLSRFHPLSKNPSLDLPGRPSPGMRAKYSKALRTAQTKVQEDLNLWISPNKIRHSHLCAYGDMSTTSSGKCSL